MRSCVVTCWIFGQTENRWGAKLAVLAISSTMHARFFRWD